LPPTFAAATQRSPLLNKPAPAALACAARRQSAEDVLRWNFGAGFMLSMPVHKRLLDSCWTPTGEFGINI
jgi:hypothetical protein